jgi:bifunctional non-homologous end joining protein LigD
VPRAEARGAHWVKPELVAEVAFAEFTSDGVVRHASFLGLRGDKKPKDVVEERPQPVEQAAPEPADGVRISNSERILFPDSNITKGELVDYYRAIGPAMMEWAAEPAAEPRPLPPGPGEQMLLPEA